MTARTDLVPAGATVAIRGFALTFIDAALALTEGRGGRFVTDPEHPQRLVYRSARGTAKRIFPRSRTGRPMLAKPGPAADDTAFGSAAAEAQGRAAIMAIGDPIEDLVDELVPVLADLAPPGRRGEMSRWLELACSGALPRSADPAAEIRRSLTAGAAPTDVRAWLGTTWRAVYPAVVEKLGADGLADDQWPAFRRLSAELERVAFGPPPVNAAKLLALIDAGVDPVSTPIAGATPEADAVLDAVMPPPGVPRRRPLVTRAGARRLRADRPRAPRDRDLPTDCECIGRDGSASRGLAAYRAADRGLGDRQRHPEPLAPPAGRAWAARVVGGGGAGVSIEDPSHAAAAASRRSTPASSLAGRDLPTGPICSRDWCDAARLADQPDRPGAMERNAARADRGGIGARNRPQDLLRPQGEQGAGARRRGAAARARASISPASGSSSRRSREASSPQDLVMTAAVKPVSLLGLCAATGTTVVIDNEDELQLLTELVESPLREPCRSPSAWRRPRPRTRLRPASGSASTRRWRWSTGTGRRGDSRIRIAGVHFHLDGYDRRATGSPRSGRALELIDALRERGHEAGFLDIGGGIPMSYLDSAEQWTRLLGRAPAGAARQASGADLRGSWPGADRRPSRGSRRAERLPVPPGTGPGRVARPGARQSARGRLRRGHGCRRDPLARPRASV